MKINYRNEKNKGFSLIELIIVISIMAILVGVTAPNYMRYIEKKRKDSDVMAIEVVMRALEVVAEDIRFDLRPGDTFGMSEFWFYGNRLEKEFSFRNGIAHPQNDLIIQEMKQMVHRWEFTSKDWTGGDLVVEGKIDTNGNVTFTLRGPYAGEIVDHAGWQGKVNADIVGNLYP